MNEVDKLRLPVTPESNKVIALTLLKSIGSRAVELVQAGIEKTGELLDLWSRPADNSEEDAFVTYDSLSR